ncbi:2-amino-4-hydroxy-6-hydroxymethyldihydropteridine diphosphokinase [Candidatus Kaiserbacteria bacterium]|nr:2-amino-4-hydroxy-6-hydroxymethyldihydropteridine diphosphokinase [Candidatus Kaiserbacteria bacterium]
MYEIYLGLGTNLGDRIGNLRRAIGELEAFLTVRRKSSVYESVPHGTGEQPLYLNMVVHAETAAQPLELLSRVKSIESSLGRAAGTHSLPRPIDIDILFHGDTTFDSAELTVPHARLHERAFVLVPLEEIAPAHVHPRLRRPIIDLLDELGGYQDVVWLSGEQL